MTSPSANSDAPATGPRPRRPSVVTLGGGHGLYVMLTALRRLDVDITAIVTVADDGGSSGRLRRDVAGVLPPGDLRMALSALAAADGDGELFGRTFQHRFGGQGALAGHPVGNIVLVGLETVLGDPVAALDAAGRMLGACGRVLPMTTRPLEIVADVAGLDEDPRAVRQIRGQVAVAATPGDVRALRLDPADAPACSEALAAIRGADLITLGPGSWFTSVLPHLLIRELGRAIADAAAHRLVVLNLAPQPGETEGFSPEQHLEVLMDHAPGLRVDTVLADARAVPLPQRLRSAADRLGASLVLRDVADPELLRHRPDALATALAEVLAARPATEPTGQAPNSQAPDSQAPNSQAPDSAARHGAAPAITEPNSAGPNSTGSNTAATPGLSAGTNERPTRRRDANRGVADEWR